MKIVGNASQLIRTMVLWTLRKTEISDDYGCFFLLKAVPLTLKDGSGPHVVIVNRNKFYL